MVHDKIKALRERINRREKNTRAKRKAKARRIEKGDPKNKREAAKVKSRKAKEEVQMTAEEARNLASDAKQLIATETGTSNSEAGKTIKQAGKLFDDLGGETDSLDFDGDGDTDLLPALEANEGDSGDGGLAVGPVETMGGERPMEFGENEGASDISDPTEPVIDFGDT